MSDVMTIGFVGHCGIENLANVKKAVEKINGFRLVHFKTTSGKFWLKETNSLE